MSKKKKQLKIPEKMLLQEVGLSIVKNGKREPIIIIDGKGSFPSYKTLSKKAHSARK